MKLKYNINQDVFVAALVICLVNSLKFVQCKIDSGNELPRLLRLGPNFMNQYGFNYLISYLLLL